MATRQTSRKSPRPVTASPTSKPPRSTAAATRPGQARSEAAAPAPTPDAVAPGKPAGQRPAGAVKPAAESQPDTAVRRALAAVRGALAATVRWSGGGLPFAAILFSVLGLADAVYLTIEHFSTATSFAGCSEHGTVNCLAVTTSMWSRLPAGTSGGIPVSVLGLGFFVFMLAINSRWGWRAPWPAVHWARLASVVVGIVFVLYLVWAELFRISAICLYCTGVHVITFILFALIVSRVVTSGVRGTGAPDHG